MPSQNLSVELEVDAKSGFLPPPAAYVPQLRDPDARPHSLGLAQQVLERRFALFVGFRVTEHHEQLAAWMDLTQHLRPHLLNSGQIEV